MLLQEILPTTYEEETERSVNKFKQIHTSDSDFNFHQSEAKIIPISIMFTMKRGVRFPTLTPNPNPECG